MNRFAASHTARWAGHNLAEAGRWLAASVSLRMPRSVWLIVALSCVVEGIPSADRWFNRLFWVIEGALVGGLLVTLLVGLVVVVRAWRHTR